MCKGVADLSEADAEAVARDLALDKVDKEEEDLLLRFFASPQ